MHNCENTIDYLSRFFDSNRALYFEIMQDVGCSRYTLAFEGEDKIIQGIRNIVHNISDTYCNLSIPEGFASPKLLLDSLTKFRDMAKNQLSEAEKINNKLGKLWFNVIQDSVKINSEVMEAITYALTLVDSKDIEISPLNGLLKLLNAFPKVAHELTVRRRQNGMPRQTILINDEYDVQDLLRALLAIDFTDVRTEEWCPSYAGGSKRVDFLLKHEQIVVEVKKTRTDHNAKKIGEELIIDIANYKKHADCSHLVCFVWDKDKRISNPRGLKDDLENSNSNFVIVHIYQ